MSQWVRLWEDMPTDPKWRVVARRAGRPTGEVIAVFVHMMTNAGRAAERGCLENWNDEDVAAALDFEPENVQAIREAMQGKTLDGAQLTGWDKRQPQREDSSVERVKAFRERKKAAETLCNAHVTPCNAPEEKREDPEKKEEAVFAREPARDLNVIERECRQAAGHLDSPSPGFFDLSPIIGLLDGGASLIDDILPALRSRPYSRARSWSYYLPQIQDFRGRRIGAAQSTAAIKPQARASPTSIIDQAFNNLFPESGRERAYDDGKTIDGTYSARSPASAPH